MTHSDDSVSAPALNPGEPGRGRLLLPLVAVVVVALVAGGVSWAFSQHDECLPAVNPAHPAVGWDTVDQPAGVPSASTAGANAPATDLLVEKWCASGVRADRVVTAGGVLFTLGWHHDLRAIDATTGATWWSVDAEDRGYYSFDAGPVLVDESVVVAGSRSGGQVGVLAFDQATGELRWDVQEGGSQAMRLVVADEVLFASVGELQTESVLAVEASSGTKLWRSQVAAAPDETSLSPQVFGLSAGTDTVVVALNDSVGNTGTLTALERDSGTERWSRPLEAVPTAGPVVHDGQVTAFGASGSYDSTVFGWSFDVYDGTEVWSTTVFPTESNTYQEPVRHLAATAAGLYALGSDLVLIDPATGSSAAAGGVTYFGGMTVAGDRIVICDEVIPIGAVEGAPLNFELADGSGTWCPAIGVVANGVYYGVDDSDLRAFGSR